VTRFHYRIVFFSNFSLEINLKFSNATLFQNPNNATPLKGLTLLPSEQTTSTGFYVNNSAVADDVIVLLNFSDRTNQTNRRLFWI